MLQHINLRIIGFSRDHKYRRCLPLRRQILAASVITPAMKRAVSATGRIVLFWFRRLYQIGANLERLIAGLSTVKEPSPSAQNNDNGLRDCAGYAMKSWGRSL